METNVKKKWKYKTMNDVNKQNGIFIIWKYSTCGVDSTCNLVISLPKNKIIFQNFLYN